MMHRLVILILAASIVALPQLTTAQTQPVDKSYAQGWRDAEAVARLGGRLPQSPEEKAHFRAPEWADKERWDAGYRAQQWAAVDPKTRELEGGYAAANAQSAACIIQALKDPAITAPMLKQMRSANAALAQATAIKFVGFSTKPLKLKENPTNPDQHFSAQLSLRFAAIDQAGAILGKQVEVRLPVFANTQREWFFPTCEDTIAAAVRAGQEVKTKDHAPSPSRR